MKYNDLLKAAKRMPFLQWVAWKHNMIRKSTLEGTGASRKENKR